MKELSNQKTRKWNEREKSYTRKSIKNITFKP